MNRKRLNRVMLRGFLLRAALLAVILALRNHIEPFFIEDDIAYEERVHLYLAYANGVFDLEYLNQLLRGYLQPLWPSVMCISAAIFRTVYAGRVINILISTACILVIYDTVLLLSGKERTALLAAKLFAYLPVTVITCCFPIKDIFLTWAVLYAFYVFLLVYQKQRLRIAQIVVVVLGLIGVYFVRGAVAELMTIFFVVLWLDSLRKQKRYRKILAVAIVVAVVLYLYGEEVVQAFVTKIEDYSGYNERSTGGLAMLQMKNPWEFYKIPFAYFFATLQPMTLNYFASVDNLWMWLLRICNISLYPVAIANVMYVFQRKHNRLYWLCGVGIYCAVISLCLGIFRHYLFLLPLEMINCALALDRSRGNVKKAAAFGTVGMVVLMTIYSLAAAL